MNRIMFFDCETNGLPVNWRAPITDLNNWPRVIQLAWLSCEETGEEVHSGDFLIKPDGWTIPTDKFWVDNGFTTAGNEAGGIPIASALQAFIDHLQHCSYMASHNMSFDYNVVGSEMIRADMKSDRRPDRICTKEVGTAYCKIPFSTQQRRYPGSKENYKWPKLSELHQKLFGRDFEGAHDALTDVRALKDCFFELARIGVIKLNQTVPNDEK